MSLIAAMLARTLQTYTSSLVFVLVTGEKDEGGVSWCPDCVTAEPHILGALRTIAESGRDVVLVECPVVRSEYKGNPSYPYRLDPHLAINDIPSLLRWGKTKPVIKLQGDQLDSTETILSLVDDE